ncbi:hypothetical protein BX070DRAFT_221482, partial [Coemansia spiralis]
MVADKAPQLASEEDRRLSSKLQSMKPDIHLTYLYFVLSVVYAAVGRQCQGGGRKEAREKD